jgi:hypothetical protein
LDGGNSTNHAQLTEKNATKRRAGDEDSRAETIGKVCGQLSRQWKIRPTGFIGKVMATRSMVKNQNEIVLLTPWRPNAPDAGRRPPLGDSTLRRILHCQLRNKNTAKDDKTLRSHDWGNRSR